MKEISRRMATGAIWMVLFKVAARSLGLVSTIILARLLLPTDFGLVAMAMSIIALLELLTAFGFDTALIHRQNVQRHHYDTAWTLNVMLGLVSALFLVGLAQPAAAFYEEPRLVEILYFLAVSAFIRGFENIGVVAFRKELKFRQEFRFLLLKKLLAFSITVPLAFLLRNYWALVLGTLVGRSGGVLLSYAIHSYRPRFCLLARTELFNFSKWMLVTNILNFLDRRSLDFIIGKVAGSHQLGLFKISFEISNLVTSELVSPINRAVYPGYAKLSAELELLRNSYLGVCSLVAVFSIPAATGVAAIAPLLIPVFFGQNWLEAIPIVQLLAFYGVMSTIQSNTIYVHYALGAPRRVTLLYGSYVSCLVPTAIFLTLKFGVFGAAVSYVCTIAIFLPFTFFLVMRALKMPFATILAVHWRPLAASAGMYLAILFFVPQVFDLSNIAGQILQLLLTILWGAAWYVSLLLGFWFITGKPSGAEAIVLNRLSGAIAGRS